MPRPRTIAVPAASLADLTGLLTRLDEFLRSGAPARAALTGFLAGRGETRPGFAACNLIDEVSFTAIWLRNLTARDGSADDDGRKEPPPNGHRCPHPEPRRG